MTYLFKCSDCGLVVEQSGREAPSFCVLEQDAWHAASYRMIRDYRAEGAGVQVFTSALGDGKVQARTVGPSD